MEEEYFQVDFVRRFTCGEEAVYEGSVDRTLFTHQEMDPEIFGPVAVNKNGGNRPWIRVTNTSDRRGILKEIYLAVLQGDATDPTVGVHDDGVMMYSRYGTGHPIKVYTKSSAATVTIRLHGNSKVRGTFELPFSDFDTFTRINRWGESYWKPRPSDAEGKDYPDYDPEESESTVTYYRATLSKPLLLDPGDTCLFECVCEWSTALPSSDPPYPSTDVYKTQWGYVFQWFTKNSCRAPFYETDPGPEPEPTTKLEPDTHLNSLVGRGTPDNWTEGLDRFLLNTNRSGARSAWFTEELKPCVRITNQLDRKGYLSSFDLSVINGTTYGTSGVVLLKDVPGSVSLPNQPCNLTARVIKDGETISTKVVIIPPTDAVGHLVQDNTAADQSYWKYRQQDKNGKAYPDSTDKALVPWHTFRLSPALELDPGETAYISFDCAWTSGNYHALQWYWVKDGEKSAFQSYARTRVRWNAGVGRFVDYPTASVLNTYHLFGTPITSEDIPQVTGGSDYRFLGWDPDPTLVTDIQSEKEFTAKWKKISGSVFQIYDAADKRWYRIGAPMIFNSETQEWNLLTHIKIYRNGTWVSYP